MISWGESVLSLLGVAAVFMTSGYLIGFKAGGYIERRWPRPRPVKR